MSELNLESPRRRRDAGEGGSVWQLRRFGNGVESGGLACGPVWLLFWGFASPIGTKGRVVELVSSENVTNKDENAQSDTRRD